VFLLDPQLRRTEDASAMDFAAFLVPGLLYFIALSVICYYFLRIQRWFLPDGKAPQKSEFAAQYYSQPQPTYQAPMQQGYMYPPQNVSTSQTSKLFSSVKPQYMEYSHGYQEQAHPGNTITFPQGEPVATWRAA